jgi:hypothetical protein
MCNRSGLWSLRPRNTEFRSIFTANWHFPLKPNANPSDFEPKFEIFKTRKNLYMGPLDVTDPQYVLYNKEI